MGADNLSPAAAPLTLARPDLFRTSALVAGRWRDHRQRFAVYDPANAGIVAEVVESDEVLAREAVDAAARAFRAWRNQTASARSAVLRRWFDLIVHNGEDIARLIALETGKPLAEGRGEVAYGAAFVEWFAEEIKRSDGAILACPMPGRRMLALKEPVGVVAVVTPWNFPLAMLTRKLAPAFAAGCTAVVKPAEDTPLTALALGVLAEEAGFPEGCLNVLPSSRDRTPEVVDVWMADMRVRKITFTGSTPVGQLLARQAADTLKRVSLELGGDAPFIVFDDADPDVALDALLKAKFRNTGQACIAANRVLVQAGVYESFSARVAEAVRRLKVGAPSEAADIGPLISARARDKVERLVKVLLDDGARLLAGGSALVRPGWFFEPTVLADIPLGAARSCEEFFGPVVALARFKTEEEAVNMANASPYGLAAYVCTSDAARAWRMAEALESGMVGVNEGAISSAVAPFGGVKLSGYGREGSRYGLADYQNIKYVCMGALS